jgi:hypothetical protein
MNTAHPVRYVQAKYLHACYNAGVRDLSERDQGIADLLDGGTWDPDHLSELGRLGAQLTFQRAVEEVVTEFLARSRYERAPLASGWRNAVRPRRVQTGEVNSSSKCPSSGGTAERFVCRTIPGARTVIRTRPLEALVIGAYRAFCARNLSGVELLALFLNAIYPPTCSSRAKEGVLVAWGYDLNGKRELLAVSLGQRQAIVFKGKRFVRIR